MGQPTRTHNRYSSLTGYRIVKGDSGDTFERIVVDREGLPVMPLTLYRYLRGAPGPDHTGDTYLDMLCPVFGYFDERGWAWDAPPEPSARMLVAYIGRAYADSIAMTSQNARLARKMGVCIGSGPRRSLLVFNLLRRRNVALLWVAGLTSGVGDAMLFVALPFYVYARTHSALATGAMFIAEMAPAVLLGSVAGVFVDRWDRRRTMIAADLARAALLLLLLAVDARDRLWIVYAVAGAEAALTQFFTPAQGALLPRLVEGRALVTANSLNAFSASLTQLVAPSLGGVVFGLLGLPSVVLADSASYLVSGLLVALIRPPRNAPAPVTSAAHPRPEAPAAFARAWREWRDGLVLIRRDRILAALFLVGAASALAQGIFIVLLVLFVRDVLRGGAVVLGWLVTAQGVGGLVGGLVGGRVSRAVAPGRIIGGALLAVGALSLVVFNVPVLPLTLVGFVLAGAVIVVLGSNRQALLQSRVDDRYRGRVLGAIGTTGALLTLLGTGTASAVGDRLGAVAGLDLACGFWLIAGVLAVALLPGDAGLPACEPAVSPVHVPDHIVPAPEADPT